MQPPTPPAHPPRGLWAEQTPAFPDAPGTRAALGPQAKAPSLDKTTLGCQSFSASGGGDENTEPSVAPSKVCRSLPALKEGPSGQSPLESRAKSTGAPHHCGQIGLGWTGDHLPPGSSPFRSCQDSLVPQGFLHPGKFCELLENHDF